MNKNENTTYKNILATTKALFRAKFIDAHANLTKEERSQLNSLTFYLKTQEREKLNPNAKIQKEIIKILEQINEIENRKIEIINEPKSLFFENFNKIDKPPAALIMKKETI